MTEINKVLLPEGEITIMCIKETLVRTVFLHAQNNVGDKNYLTDLQNLKNLYLYINELQNTEN